MKGERLLGTLLVCSMDHSAFDPVGLAPQAIDAVPVVVPSRPRRHEVPSGSASPDLSTSWPAIDAVASLQGILQEDHDYDVPLLRYPIPADFVLSVVIPVFNERETIVQLLARVCALPIPLQLVIVDDCSTDGTADILRLFAGVDQFRILLKARNQGKGAALRDGFARATGSVVIVQDADLEYDPRDILDVIQPIVTGKADIVFGSRFSKKSSTGSSGVHQLGNRLLTWVSNLTTGLPITDMETCYKAFRREVLTNLPLRQNRFGFEPEITAKIARRGYRVDEVPIRYHARDWSQGKKIGWKDGINALYCIARYALAD